MDAVGHEKKGRSSLHRDRRASVVRQHEDGYMVGRVLAPPSLPTVVVPGATHWPEHVAAYDPGADVLETARGEVVVNAFPADLVTDQRSSEVASHLLERLRAEYPLVQRHPSGAHRIGQVLVKTGAIALNGDSKCVDSEPRHERHVFRRCSSRRSAKRGVIRTRKPVRNL